MISSLKNTGIAFVLTIFTVLSCKSYSRDNTIVARIGDHVLSKSDIRNLIPPGTPHNDSIAMLQKYVNTWALKYLLVNKAEKEIPNIKNDISKEVEEYRNSLLAYRYEKQYIDQRLDTVVTPEECRQYYLDNKNDLILTNSAVKARVIKIASTSPNLARIKSMYQTQSSEDIEELEQICYNSADRYVNFSNQWIDLSFVAREVPVDISNLESNLRSRNYVEAKDSLYNYFAFFYEVAPPNSVAPFEFYQKRITEIIIGRRKQELIHKLEKDLITEALNNNTITTTINKDI